MRFYAQVSFPLAFTREDFCAVWSLLIKTIITYLYFILIIIVLLCLNC